MGDVRRAAPVLRLCYGGRHEGRGPWTKNNEKMGKCIWNCVWFVVWFNVLFAAICIAIGWICGTVGFNNNLGVAKTEGGMLFVYAFLVGGLLAAFFQILFVCLKKVTKKVTPLHILITAWMLGAIFAPFGISGALANFSGEGASPSSRSVATICSTWASSSAAATCRRRRALVVPLAVAGLAITGRCSPSSSTAGRFGRKPLEQVHAEKALNSLFKELGYDALHGEEARQGRARGLRRRGRKRCACRYERVGEGLSDRFSYDGCASCVSRTRVAGVRFATRLALRFILAGFPRMGEARFFFESLPYTGWHWFFRVRARRMRRCKEWEMAKGMSKKGARS